MKQIKNYMVIAIAVTCYSSLTAQTNVTTSTSPGGTANYLPKYTGQYTVEKSSIFDNGNVGIGTNIPSKRLHVVGDAQIDNLGFNSFSGNSWIDANNSLLINYFSRKETNINTAWALQTDPTTGNTTATQDGGQINLGAKVNMVRSLRLGWSSLAMDLNTNIEINQSDNNATAVKVKTWNSGIKAFCIEDANGKNRFAVFGNGNTVINQSGQNYSNIGHFDVVNENLGTNAGDKAYWANFAGNVGIGNIDQLRVFQNRYVAGSNWNSSEIKLQRTVGTSNMSFISFRSTNLTWGMSAIVFGHDNTDHMSISYDGKVSIGALKMTGTHSDAKLSVDGKAVAKEIIVTTSNWADYVFANGYKLPNLYDVEKYYLANKHLPEVPSEKEVIDNGINVSEMNVILLKKIEEMTILMVKQQKEIDAMKQKLDIKE
jgi:hypothetical protein